MMTYKVYEKEVFDWLMDKHEQNPEFTFSVRKKASKGSETDIFIGTEKSGYFATSFWNIPCGYPGSSIDLIVLGFSKSNEGYDYWFEFFFTRNPEGQQNEAALDLINESKPEIKELFPDRFSSNSPNNKMEKFTLKTDNSFETTEDLFSDLDLILPQVIEVVDDKIESVKKKYPSFTAHRYTKKEFDELLNKMEERIEKHGSKENQAEIDNKKPSRSSEERFKSTLNQILYGPPGTGKTYHTLNHALAILENNESYLNDDNFSRDELHELINKYKEKNQVRFVTFHPSFTYEDFVEGIKPTLHEDGKDQKEISYEIKPGIFKQICESATAANQLAKKEKEGLNVPDEVLFSDRYFKISLGDSTNPDDDEIYQYCIDNNLAAIGYLDDIDCTDVTNKDDIEKLALDSGYSQDEFGIKALDRFKLRIGEGDIIFVSDGNLKLRAVGIAKTQNGKGYFYDPNSDIDYNHFRHVEWVLTNLKIPVHDIYYARFMQQTIYELKSHKVKKDYFKTEEDNSIEEKRYVLIIDEINRGNVPSIFGELITLIEKDKRAGGREKTSVILPYSKDESPFEVPSNLYIIGTMNTADRSVEALDIALRRRFEFKSFYPDSTKIKQPEDFEVDLKALLTGINDRIEYLLDRDHTIGHSYFMDLYKSDDPTKDLELIFKDKIIPLLEEYFYGQLQNIGLVLGSDFIESKFKEAHSTTLFPKNFSPQETPNERVVYRIVDPTTFKTVQPFINIYDES